MTELTEAVATALWDSSPVDHMGRKFSDADTLERADYERMALAAIKACHDIDEREFALKLGPNWRQKLAAMT